MKYLLSSLTLALSLNAFALNVGENAPCVILNQISANNSEAEHCIRDHADTQKFTLIEFFSINCSDCQANLPGLTQLGTSVSATANTRLVSIDRDEAAVRMYIGQNRSALPFEVALDTSRDAKTAYGVVQTPTLFVLDSNNAIIFKHSGVLSQKDISDVQTLVELN